MLIIIKVLLIILMAGTLTGCESPLISGAQLVYGRHKIHKGISDQSLQVKANHALFDYYPQLKRKANISITVFNKSMLVVGQVPNEEDKELVSKVLSGIKNGRQVYNELTVGQQVGLVQSLRDTWTTSKLRARMIVENNINPSQFKVVTEDGVVYLMGDVKPEESRIVVTLAKRIDGVKKVVKAFRYYRYVSPEVKKTT